MDFRGTRVVPHPVRSELMRSHRRTASLLVITVLCVALVACKSDPFIGTWKPAPSGDSDVTRIDSFNINKDGTFSLKAKDPSRKEIKGTYTKTGDKLELSSPDFRQKVEASMESDGRLKVSEGGRDAVYFVKG
ncbi:MAG: hypothetical protein QOJ64_4474 [Acidobacteriota bacterium]|nr:hypothetical protein [Acidobacteriota bacterium]